MRGDRYSVSFWSFFLLLFKVVALIIFSFHLIKLGV